MAERIVYVLVALVLGILFGPAVQCFDERHGCYTNREHPERGCVRCGHFGDEE